MRRILAYDGEIPYTSDILSTNRNVMVALGKLAQDILGSSTCVSGLVCSPTIPGSLAVQIGIGNLYSPQPVDATAYGDLGIDTADIIIKQGILLTPVTLSTPAPVTIGQSINYLIEAQYQDSDTALQVLPYYNSANPTSPLSGPGGLGTPQATQRDGIISLIAKAGVAAATGSQITPTVDSGYLGLWVVTVSFGSIAVVSGNIAQYPGAPFLTFNALTALTQANADLRYLQLYARTLTEIAAGVIPVSLLYPAGDLRRYGADPTGSVASDVALTSALACNSDVFDGQPGGGTYLFNTGVTITKYPVTIRGQAKNNKDVAGLNGTVFVLGGAAAAGAAILQASYLDTVRIQNIGFQFQSGNLSQFGIHIKPIGGNAGQLRTSIIEGCVFISTGGGATADTNTGIQLDTGTASGQYSGYNTFRDNYFSHLYVGIGMSGACTYNSIISNGFLGYSGISSAVQGSGVFLVYPVAEVKLLSNYFEGWNTGINSSGGANIQQIANDYQVCLQGYNWAQTTRTFLLNQSFGETGVAGVVSGITNTDATQMQTAGPGGWLATGSPIQSTRGFQEGGGPGTNLRAAGVGYGTTAPVTMAANGGGTISSQVTTTWSFSFVGGTLYLQFSISATLAGSGSTALTLPLPGGPFPIVPTQTPCSVLNNGTTAFGLAYVNPGSANLNVGLGATGAGSFTAGPVSISGQIAIRIIS